MNKVSSESEGSSLVSEEMSSLTEFDGSFVLSKGNMIETTKCTNWSGFLVNVVFSSNANLDFSCTVKSHGVLNVLSDNLALSILEVNGVIVEGNSSIVENNSVEFRAVIEMLLILDASQVVES